jgi:FAD:protein FMN transferase
MGLPVSLHVRGQGVRTGEVEALVGRVFSWLHRVDAMFSTYRADSQVSALQRGELRPQEADPLVQEVFELGAQAWRATDGYFDDHLPTGDGGRRYDPTGLVKGWAVARAAVMLNELDDHAYCLNAGGDIAMGGRRAQPWRIGVEDPVQRARMLDIVTVLTGAVATSGSAARGTHIVNPHTGRPAASLLAVTVRGPSILWADVHATAVVAEGAAGLRRLERLGGYEATAVTADGRRLRTSGWDRGLLSSGAS